MTNQYRFKMSLRITHPSASAEAISQALQHSPDVAWSAGEGRATPTGTELRGTRKDTYWTFELDHTAGIELEQAIDDFLEALPNRDFLKQVRATGGKAELFVGWFFEAANCGLTLECRTMQRLAEFGIDLSIDAYR